MNKKYSIQFLLPKCNSCKLGTLVLIKVSDDGTEEYGSECQRCINKRKLNAEKNGISSEVYYYRNRGNIELMKQIKGFKRRKRS